MKHTISICLLCKKYLVSIFAPTFILFSLNGTCWASILQFDQIRDSSGSVIPAVSGNQVEQDYGDRVTGTIMNVPGGQFTYGNEGEGFTSNVSAEYFTGNATINSPNVSVWGSGYGDLTNVIIGTNNSLSLNVRLTADAGFNVELYHFDLAGWPGSDYTINAVQVLSGSSALFSQSDVLVEGDANGEQHTAFDFLSPLMAQELLIQIDYSNLAGSQHDNIGIDNIRFGQTPPAAVPLPASGLLIVSGLAVLGVIRRRTRVY